MYQAHDAKKKKKIPIRDKVDVIWLDRKSAVEIKVQFMSY